jgi:hypothetical protein
MFSNYSSVPLPRSLTCWVVCGWISRTYHYPVGGSWSYETWWFLLFSVYERKLRDQTTSKTSESVWIMHTTVQPNPPSDPNRNRKKGMTWESEEPLGIMLCTVVRMNKRSNVCLPIFLLFRFQGP